MIFIFCIFFVTINIIETKLGFFKFQLYKFKNNFLQTNKSLTEEKIISLSFGILFVLYDQDYDDDHY